MVSMDFYGFLHVLWFSLIFFEHLETGWLGLVWIHAFAQDVLDATTAIATQVHGQATGANTAPGKRSLEPLSWETTETCGNLRKPTWLTYICIYIYMYIYIYNIYIYIYIYIDFTYLFVLIDLHFCGLRIMSILSIRMYAATSSWWQL